MEDQAGARVSAALDHRGEDGAAPTGRDRSRPEDPLRSPAQTRKAIEGERDLLAAALEAADVLLVIFDDQGRILRVNHAFEVATGHRGGDLRGRDFFDTLPIPEARETFTDGIRSLRAGVAMFAFENHWLKRVGVRGRRRRWSSPTSTTSKQSTMPTGTTPAIAPLSLPLGRSRLPFARLTSWPASAVTSSPSSPTWEAMTTTSPRCQRDSSSRSLGCWRTRISASTSP